MISIKRLCEDCEGFREEIVKNFPKTKLENKSWNRRQVELGLILTSAPFFLTA
jgi:hypothetical protein